MVKKQLGFSSFEFYFVVSIVGLIFLFGVERYKKLAEETRHLSFEILAQNFSAAVYSQHARWIIAQQSPDKLDTLKFENMFVHFSAEGWPVAVGPKEPGLTLSLSGCGSLWNSFLQKPPAIAFEGKQNQEFREYNVALTDGNQCRYEWLMPDGRHFYFEYSPTSGQVKTFPPAIAKNS